MAQAIRPLYDVIDAMRRAQGDGLGALGFGPEECEHQIIASGSLWRLRQYSQTESGPSVLIVAAPIKRPYIWDLSPSVSAIRYCLRRGLRVHLLEWRPPTSKRGACGLAEYADDAISEAMAVVSRTSETPRPVLMGHSLGGILAATFAALHPGRLAGLVLLSAPLCFSVGASSFRDAISTMAPPWLSQADVIPGSLLTQLSALASPETFFWSRLMDAAASGGDPRAQETRTRVERWALDEVPISGKLAREVLLDLYLDNRLCTGTLAIRDRLIEPSRLDFPVLAVANAGDDVAPPASVSPFLDAMAGPDKRLIAYPGEAGVVLQHLGVLVGRDALSVYWPEIVSWIKEHG